MNNEEIKIRVETLLRQSQAGQEIENPKIDCKLHWYKLNAGKGRNEFLKDTSAIANTFGPDGFIIIGYDDKQKVFHSSKFLDSGLRDSSDIYPLINKHVADSFDIALYEMIIDDHSLSILHIPASINKPHVIKSYQSFDQSDKIRKEESQRIFIRKNSGTYPATKYDLELMYYDRKNVQPEYDVYVNVDLKSINLESVPQSEQRSCLRVIGTMAVTFENLGRRSLSIKKFSCMLALFEDASDHEKIDLQMQSLHESGHRLILRSLDIAHLNFEMISHSFYGKPFIDTQKWVTEIDSQKKNLFVGDFMIETTNGIKILPKVSTLS